MMYAGPTGYGYAEYCLDSTVLSSSSCGGTFTVYTVFSDPAELYGNSQATVNITVTPGSGCVSAPKCQHCPEMHSIMPLKCMLTQRVQRTCSTSVC